MSQVRWENCQRWQQTTFPDFVGSYHYTKSMTISADCDQGRSFSRRARIVLSCSKLLRPEYRARVEKLTPGTDMRLGLGLVCTPPGPPPPLPSMRPEGEEDFEERLLLLLRSGSSSSTIQRPSLCEMMAGVEYFHEQGVHAAHGWHCNLVERFLVGVRNSQHCSFCWLVQQSNSVSEICCGRQHSSSAQC